MTYVNPCPPAPQRPPRKGADQAVTTNLKDHQIAALVNDLRDIAVEFHGAQQLRERISHRVRAALASPVPASGAKAETVAMEHDPLVDFQEGQWWVAELDAMARAPGSTDDQKRAVAVVHNFLRGTAALASPAQAPASIEKAMEESIGFSRGGFTVEIMPSEPVKPGTEVELVKWEGGAIPPGTDWAFDSKNGFRVFRPKAPAATEAPSVPPEFDVRRILLEVVPGDGDGLEVYAKSVKDVEDLLGRMGEELEEWQLGMRRLPAPTDATEAPKS